MESPFNDERMARLIKSEREEPAGPVVVVDVNGFTSVTREALLAHATQVDPTSRHWFGLPPEVADNLYPYEEYEVARDLTGAEDPAADVFAGIAALPV